MNTSRKNVLISTLAALLLGLASSHVHAYYYVNFLDQSNNETLSGNNVEVRIQTDAPDAQTVRYWVDGLGNKLVKETSTPPYFYFQWDTTSLTPGLHGLGAEVLNSTGTQIAWSYINVYISTGAPVPLASACADMVVEVRNYSTQFNGGGMWGAGFGSSGFAAQPNGGVNFVSLPSGGNHIGPYNLVVFPSGNQGYGTFNCSADIPSSGNCPSIRPIVSITDGSCWIYTYQN